MIKIKLVFFYAALLVPFLALSQSKCQEDIDKANKLFEDGIYREAEKLVKNSLENCDLDKTQENELLKMMASIYYEMDELEMGDEFVKEFVKKNPYYMASKKNDPYQFREALKKIKTWPMFTVGLKAGVPLGWVTTEKVYPVLDTADYLQPYKLRPAFQTSLEFAWNISQFFSVRTGGGLRIQKLQHQVTFYDQLNFNYQEMLTTINIPFSVQVSLPFWGSFMPAVYFGGEFEYFADANYSYFYTGNSNISDQMSFYLNLKREGGKIELSERNQYRYAAVGGLRLIYKLDKLSLFADVRYVREFDLYNNPDERYADADLFVRNNYTLADVKFESLDISLGVLYSFSYRVKSKY